LTKNIRWDLAKTWLLLTIDRWRVQEHKREITPDDVVEFLHERGFIAGDAWEKFVSAIPDDWIRRMY